MAAIQSISFSNDGKHVIYGTNSGFVTFVCQPFKAVLRDNEGDLSSVEIFDTYASKVIACVHERCPKKLWVWDVEREIVLGKLPQKNRFNSRVIGIRITKSYIAAVLEDITLLFKMWMDKFKGGKFRFSITQEIATVPNPRGLCSLVERPSPQGLVLACPGVDEGQIRVEHYGDANIRKTSFITTHGSSIACFTLSSDGKILATASMKGTLIRLFDTVQENQLLELRRGIAKADIYSMAFSKDAEWLVVSSEKRTVHVFRVKSAIAERSAALTASSISIVKGLAPAYLRTERSFAQYRLPKDMKTVVAFGQDSSVFIAAMDGSFISCTFDTTTRGKEMIAYLYDVKLDTEE